MRFQKKKIGVGTAHRIAQRPLTMPRIIPFTLKIIDEPQSNNT